MKNFLLMAAALVIAVLAGCADMKIAENANQPIEIVLEAPGKTQGQLYSSAKSWMAETRTAGMSVDDADKDSGRIIVSGKAAFPCDGFMDCRLKNDTYIKFSLRIDTKDGKIRMTYTNLVKSSPRDEHRIHEYDDRAIVAQGDLDAAKRGAQVLSNELLSYATKQSASAKNW
jgi:hypothetical protein